MRQKKSTPLASHGLEYNYIKNLIDKTIIKRIQNQVGYQRYQYHDEIWIYLELLLKQSHWATKCIIPDEKDVTPEMTQIGKYASLDGIPETAICEHTKTIIEKRGRSEEILEWNRGLVTAIFHLSEKKTNRGITTPAVAVAYWAIKDSSILGNMIINLFIDEILKVAFQSKTGWRYKIYISSGISVITVLYYLAHGPIADNVYHRVGIDLNILVHRYILTANASALSDGGEILNDWYLMDTIANRALVRIQLMYLDDSMLPTNRTNNRDVKAHNGTTTTIANRYKPEFLKYSDEKCGFSVDLGFGADPMSPSLELKSIRILS